MLDPVVERRPWHEQLELDDGSFREQVAYLLERSPFYERKLSGFDVTGGLGEIAQLPFTEKQELKESETEESPFGAHFCASPEELVRIYSTSGTTGTPSYIPLTASDLDNWVTASARSYSASGLAPGERVVTTYNAGPFVAGAALDAFERIGVCHVPVGTGSTERLLLAVERLRPDAVVLTPSYAAHLLERAEERGVDLPGSSVRRVIVAGEPGGGEPEFRTTLEQGWGAKVTEAMGVGDIGPSLFGECEEQKGMHLGARGFVHVEVINPVSGSAVELDDGVEGELVLTHLRHGAAPILRFRTRDHVHVWTGTCACGRTSPRIRCLGRTDDMLIVRGVNVFPSAIRDVVSAFVPAVSGHVLVRPREPGVKQEPPLPVAVELGRDAPIDTALAAAIRERIHAALVVQAQVELVPWGSLQRSEYKAQLIAHKTKNRSHDFRSREDP